MLDGAGETAVTGFTSQGREGDRSVTRELQPRVNRIRVKEPDAVKEGFLEEGTPSSLQSL